MTRYHTFLGKLYQDIYLLRSCAPFQFPLREHYFSETRRICESVFRFCKSRSLDRVVRDLSSAYPYVRDISGFYDFGDFQDYAPAVQREQVLQYLESLHNEARQLYAGRGN